jgi:hypothetical protein
MGAGNSLRFCYFNPVLHESKGDGGWGALGRGGVDLSVRVGRNAKAKCSKSINLWEKRQHRECVCVGMVSL